MFVCNWYINYDDTQFMLYDGGILTMMVLYDMVMMWAMPIGPSKHLAPAAELFLRLHAVGSVGNARRRSHRGIRWIQVQPERFLRVRLEAPNVG